MGRKKLYSNRVTVPLSDEMLESMDAVLMPKEQRLDMVRSAIEREVARRKLSPSEDEGLTFKRIDNDLSAVETSIKQLRETLDSEQKLANR